MSYQKVKHQPKREDMEYIYLDEAVESLEDGNTIAVRRKGNGTFQILTREDGYKQGSYGWLELFCNTTEHDGYWWGCQDLRELLSKTIDGGYELFLVENPQDLGELLQEES
jgi:hypothetical protein